MNATDDRELERYLQRGDPLSRAYAALKAERPSPALDQAVLARARDALQGEPATRPLRRRRWPALAALAATVLLSFALVMRVALEPDTGSEQPAVTSESWVPPPKSVPPAVPPAESDADRIFPTREEARGLATSSANTPAQSPIEARRPDIEEQIRVQAEAAPAIVEPVSPDSVPRSLQPPQAAPMLRGEREGESALSTTRAKASMDRYATEQPAEAPPAVAVQSDASLKAVESVKSPALWLEEIEQLRAAGELEAAERELEHFKAAYPGYLEAQASPPQK